MGAICQTAMRLHRVLLLLVAVAISGSAAVRADSADRADRADGAVDTSADRHTPALTDFVYGSPWTAWQFKAEQDYCVLYAPLAEYGEARFVARPDGELFFELQARRDQQGSPMAVSRVAPDWHPQAGAQHALGHLRHLQGAGSSVSGELAETMLLALRAGYVLDFHGRSAVAVPQALQWSVQPVGFIPALDEFRHCAHTRLSVAWHDISRTRLHFDTDQHNLTAQAKMRLDAVASYVRQDPAVTTLYVDGHTDSSGTERGNRPLSKRRAEAAAQYLRDTQGLADRKFVIRYHAADYPVADNGTVAGRAENRRTTVRLERKSASQDVASRP